MHRIGLAYIECIRDFYNNDDIKIFAEGQEISVEIVTDQTPFHDGTNYIIELKTQKVIVEDYYGLWHNNKIFNDHFQFTIIK